VKEHRIHKKIIAIIFLLLGSQLFAISWPIAPVDSVHPLGNNWGNYQNYGGGPYFHNGIDIITPGQQGAPVYAVAHGWVKTWLTIQARYHWRLAIADSNLAYTDSCEGWLYAHIDTSRFHKNIGDEVQEGELIGYLVPWPVAGFDHLHFARIKDEGSTWDEADWEFVQNPLLILSPNTDTIAPKFENARAGQMFAFFRNNSNVYLSPDSLNGDIDIIAKIYDKTGVTTTDTVWDKLAPFRIEYSIRGEEDSVPTTLFVQFSGIINQGCIRVIYKTSNPCRSRGDYNYRDYYFIVTNTDGDSILETTDSLECWQTAYFPNGWYYVKVTAYDVSENFTTESMPVFIYNGVEIADNLSPALPSKMSQITISPNPVISNLNIQLSLSEAEHVNLKIFDNSGRLNKELVNEKFAGGNYILSYQLEHSGIYFIVVRIGDRNFTEKIISRR
jgi:hypothetical protein